MERSNDFAKAMFEVNKALHNLAVAILAESGEGASAPEGQTVNHTVIIFCQGGPEPDAISGACTQCQCDSCDGRDTCTMFPWKDGSIHPPPCRACRGKTGPLKPVYSPMCPGYQREADTPQEGGQHDQG